MKKSINYKKLAVNIALPLLVGAVSAWISRDGMKAFETMVQPPLSPPSALFPVVWTILYILMGIASYIVAQSGSDDADNALTLYAVQLGLNFFWSLFFFKFGMYLFAFFWLAVLWLFIFLTARSFGRINKTARNLLIPYLVWVGFAGYLNLGVYLLNN